MGIEVAIILGLASLFGTIVGVATNKENNEFIDKTNKENREFTEQTNEQNHKWSLEAAEWEYQHSKPQTQYADLLAAGITPAAAAQQISGANVSYSPATAVAPQNMPKSTNMLNDSLQQVIGEVGDFASMEQALATANKTKAETKVISETAIKKANAEIDKILADTLKSYSDISVNDSNISVNDSNIAVNDAQIEATNANTELTNEKINTEQANRKAIELSNEEKAIQLEFTRETLKMSILKTQGEIKLLSEQTAKLKEEIGSMKFDNKYQEWRNTYIETYGVAPEQGWEDTLFKAIVDGKAEPMLDAFTKSLQLIFDSEVQKLNSRSDDFYDKIIKPQLHWGNAWFSGHDQDWHQEHGYW